MSTMQRLSRIAVSRNDAYHVRYTRAPINTECITPRVAPLKLWIVPCGTRRKGYSDLYDCVLPCAWGYFKRARMIPMQDMCTIRGIV